MRCCNAGFKNLLFSNTKVFLAQILYEILSNFGYLFQGNACAIHKEYKLNIKKFCLHI